jgi:hypothetical protein
MAAHVRAAWEDLVSRSSALSVYCSACRRSFCQAARTRELADDNRALRERLEALERRIERQ